jgi:DNA-binding response OmpR family regulator
MSSATILSVSLDSELGKLRAMVLSSAGYAVTTANSPELATLSLPSQPNILLLCHTLSAAQCDALMVKCREVSPKTTIVLMTKLGYTACRMKPDIIFESNDGPQALINVLKTVSAKRNEAAN